MNKDLYNEKIPFPKDKREHMKKCFSRVKNADENIEGFKRNKELQSSEFIGYKQLKRIKNFFDNFKGKENDPSFVLNGGFIIKNWVNNELRKMREYGYMTKKNKQQSGMQNAFIKPHEKNNPKNIKNVARPSKEHSRPVDIYNASVTESLRRINEIISKI